MKKIKILLLLLTVTVAGFYSCTDNDPVENEVVTTKSISLRTTLNEIKKANNISGKNGLTTDDQFFCFGFVYPISLSYNDGTVITVSSYEGLIEILTNETSTLYIEGIEFPFQVQQEGAVTTINNEAEFFALIDDCTFYTVNDIVFDFTCYSIVFPISVVNANGQTIVVDDQTELVNLASPTPTGTSYQLDIVFPISVVQNDQTIVINNLYEFFDLNNDCPSSSCVCPADYNPVCVQTSAGVVEYSNMCHAECDGFTAADLVSCDPVTTVNFGTGLGSCFNMAYPVQVQSGGALVTVNSDDNLRQYYFPALSSIPAFVYPVTVTFNSATGPVTVLITSSAQFETAITNNCN
ncbi:Kazal-type serine protease inhibitor family protein [Flavobacterium sangjuense]|uniref:Kazal-like domain-containing protein n=1 Tax=Flavobacterium sangjuense TaxID=2518177 RepID=A0A4P7PUE7_9FLAO|nr:Kazal-type serine protease inhibitor [Flavobacterium sangjuense]QBZ97930.1 hypothetical protein GS03_01428 [Flavobacterium sangjuense]